MDALKPFIQRIGQPIILSFCISWIFFNWKIVIGLLWYDANTLPTYGYQNYIELITKNSNIFKNYICPFFTALLFPIVRFVLNWLNTFVRTKERNLLLKVTSTGKMSTLRFVELKKSYDDRLAQISEFIDSESELQTKLNEAITQIDRTKTELNNLTIKYNNSVSSENNLNSQLEIINKELDSIKLHKEKVEKISSPVYLLGKYTYTIWHEQLYNNKSSNSNPIDNGILNIELREKKYYFNFTSNNENHFYLYIENYFYDILKDNLMIIFNSDSYDSENNQKNIFLDKLTNDYFIIYKLSQQLKSIYINSDYQLEFERTF